MWVRRGEITDPSVSSSSAHVHVNIHVESTTEGLVDEVNMESIQFTLVKEMFKIFTW